MLDAIRTFFRRKMSLPPSGDGEEGTPGAQASADEERRRLHVAACALLLELVYADEEFSEAERTHLEAALRRHFDIDETAVRELMALAERERAAAVDLYQFTSLIRSSYDVGQKTVLAEVMWGLVLADGEIAKHEAYLLRRIANLLDLEPGYLAAARKRAAGDS
jgi:uncharacterized tellurite resistance protein B-like protein